MNVKFVNSRLTFVKGAKTEVLNPSRTEGTSFLSGSLGYYMDSNSYNTMYFYDLATIGVKAGDTVHIKTTHPAQSGGKDVPGVVCFNTMVSVSGSTPVQMANANCGSLRGETPSPVSAVFRVIDSDYVIPNGAVLLAVVKSNAATSFVCEVSRQIE